MRSTPKAVRKRISKAIFSPLTSLLVFRQSNSRKKIVFIEKRGNLNANTTIGRQYVIR